MQDEIARYRCTSEDGTYVTVIESRYSESVRTDSGLRHRPGARRLALDTGGAVRYIDAQTFEIIASGELLHRLT